ncbi:origin recognition complex subunit 2 [Plectosphaerella plurivora]|uniref:Origin recognition complex subunit 2 n=1 Tax=Plectosphaerella plurivora TaxID=936078 RepID=A0A9P9ABA6_9PEZI|nr:origin recognition complex subunit 2 [Plectosphaerella plurivora]
MAPRQPSTTMSRRETESDDVTASPSIRSARKRDADADDGHADTIQRTPSKRQRRLPAKLKDYDLYEVPSDGEEQEEAPRAKPPPQPVSIAEPTPTPKRKRGRPRKDANATPGTTTPSKAKKLQLAVTPIKATGLSALTPRKKAAVDRSAKRKIARAMIESVINDDASDQDDAEGLAREIYSSSDEDERENGATTTPSKKTPARRGGRRPKARSPTPPRDLPAHELFFEHNKPGRVKTSNNTLASLDLLTHEEYFSLLKTLRDPHEEGIAFLHTVHEASFGQWLFELAQGFSICLYGLGSKRALLRRFAEHAYNHGGRGHTVVIVNGYVQTLTLRDILSRVVEAMDLDPAVKVPAQPQAMLTSVLSLLSDDRATPLRRLTLLLNSIDASALRKSTTQHALSRLAAHPRVRLLCSADTPDFPLLWDAAVRASYNFIFHDATTFAPPAAELDPVDDVHTLLGRQTGSINGKEGVAFVLRSLPENAKNLFRLLVTEVLVAMDDEAGENPGVEYRMLYNKALEEFICSSEMAFRTLLKEFHDHQMIESRKDAIGTELLSVPFRKEEMEGILEDLMT